MTLAAKPHVALIRPLLAAIATTLLFPMAAYAQEGDVEEIVVSVRKTDESLQEVPVAVTVLNEDFITKESIRTLSDVAAQTPSLQFDQGFWPSDTRISIRGLFARAGRPSAAVLIDGIDASSESLQSSGGSALLNQRLLDLERIEVARGPQSALYGRAAFSGGINYITKRPQPEFAATLTADGAQDGRYELQGIFEGPITDDLAFGVVLSHYELDGYYENQLNGDDVGGGESDGIGFSLNWTPSDDFSAYWNTTYSNDEFDPQAVVLVRADTLRGVDESTGQLFKNFPNAGGECGNGVRCLPVVTGDIKAKESQINISSDPRDPRFNVDSANPTPENARSYDGTDDETFRTYLVLDWNMGWANLRSSTSYTDADNEIRLDTTQNYGLPDLGPPADVLSPQTFPGFYNGNYSDAFYDFEFTQYYQEFQLSNNDDESFDWLIGLNYFYEEAEDRNQSRVWYRDPNNPACFAAPDVCGFNTVINRPTAFDKTQERDTTSYSVFGLVGFDLTDRLKLTLEGRLIYDEVEIEGTTVDQLANVLAPFAFSYNPNADDFDDDVDDTNFVPRASLDWLYTDNVMFYTSVAKGIKPPTYNSTDIFDPVIQRVDREKLWTYEVGSKTQWLDNALTVNTALFYNDYKDAQTRVQFPAPPGGFLPVSGTVNAGDVDVWGFELDSTWRIGDKWTTGFNYAYTNSEYDDLNLKEESPTDPQGNAFLSNSEIVKAGNLEADFSGNDTPGVPEHAFSLFGQYTDQLTRDVEWYAQATWLWQDDRYADAANLVTLESYSLVNTQIGIQTEEWFASFYVENLFDDDTVRYAQEFIDQTEGIRGDLGFAFPVGYYAYLPQPQTFGVRVQYRIK